MRKFSKGNKVRFIGHNEDFNEDVTYGAVYVITGLDEDGDALFYGDDEDGVLCFISKRTEHLFETIESHDALQSTYGEYSPATYEIADEEIPVEASPTVIELLANISRRLYEAEKEITELNEKQAIFFDIDKLMKIRIFDLERQNRVQAYEINELYKAVAERG